MEDVLPPETQEGASFEHARIRQFTVFLPNKVGRLQMLVRTLEAGVSRIVGLSLEESSDATLVRLIVSDPDSSRDALAENNFSFIETDLIAVELPKRNPQPLLSVCSALLAAEINIHYAYPLLFRPRGPSLALYVDDLTLAARLLVRKGFVLIGESDLSS
jgi:hypothetical protein